MARQPGFPITRWWVTVFVSCVPVAVHRLATLIRQDTTTLTHTPTRMDRQRDDLLGHRSQPRQRPDDLPRRPHYDHDNYRKKMRAKGGLGKHK